MDAEKKQAEFRIIKDNYFEILAFMKENIDVWSLELKDPLKEVLFKDIVWSIDDIVTRSQGGVIFHAKDLNVNWYYCDHVYPPTHLIAIYCASLIKLEDAIDFDISLMLLLNDFKDSSNKQQIIEKCFSDVNYRKILDLISLEDKWEISLSDWDSLRLILDKEMKSFVKKLPQLLN